MGIRNRPLTVRLEAKEFEVITREARMLHLTDSAYVRLLLERGRDRMFLQHVANELKDTQSPDAREAQLLELTAIAETRALVRALAVRTIGADSVRKEQDQLAPGIQTWRTKLKVPDRGNP